MAGRKPGAPKTGGRQKGTPNKATRELKEAILQAAVDVGEDEAGTGGLTGYLRKVAKEDVKAFAGLLGKVLPLQVANPDGEAFRFVTTVELVAPDDDSEG